MLASCYNVGPEENDRVTIGELVSLFCLKWGDGACWIDEGDSNAPHEAAFGTGLQFVKTGFQLAA